MNPYTVTDAENDLLAALGRDATEEEIARLTEILDALDEPAASVSMLAAALWYAEQGLHVFPLQAGLKIPHKGTRGCKDASSDPGQIRAWWDRWPDSNLAIATGRGIDVIDVDGPVGVLSYARVLEELPPIYGKVSTPRPGGLHLYVAAVPGRGNKAGLLEGIDYRGQGGYVVAPPSVNEQGTYHWLRPLDVAALTQDGAA